MAQAGRIVALGLTLAVGVLAGVAIERTTATPTTTASLAGAAPSTVAITIQADPVTVQADPVTVQAEPVTVTMEPQPTADPSGPKANGNYLVGAELAAGTWKCGKGGELIYWAERNRGGDLIDNGLSTLATIDESTYIADLTGCAATWTRVS